MLTFTDGRHQAECADQPGQGVIGGAVVHDDDLIPGIPQASSDWTLSTTPAASLKAGRITLTPGVNGELNASSREP